MTSRQITAEKLLEISGSYWRTSALHAAVKLDLFTRMGDRPISAEALAHILAADKRALAMLLNALTAMGLLEKSGEAYAKTSASTEFLSKDSDRYLGHIILHHYHLVASWFQLEQAILTGGPVRTRASFDDAERREAFLMGMFNMAVSTAPDIVARIDLSGRKHFLDLGGGPGTYAIYFCRANPELTATVYDLPTTRLFAEKTIARFDLTDRIRFVDGDYVGADRIKGSYDVAWLSQILHGEGMQTCRRIVGKAAAALRSGGLLIVHEFILDNAKDGPLFPALFSLNMLLGTEAGQAYSEKEIMEMLSAAGLQEIRRIPLDAPNGSGLIAGTVPQGPLGSAGSR